MKILHITNEFSKKNFSISSLIVYISKLFEKNFADEINIVTTEIDKSLFDQKNIDLIKYPSWIEFFYKSSNKLKNKIKDSDIIHVHGIWAPIQIFSIIFTIGVGKKLIIHPHGMLLKEALESAGIIKLVLKIITLKILKLLIKDNVSFISITNQESQAIKKYFSTTNLKEIPNPIPFDLSEQKNNKKLKQLIYFGRIHPHKNLELLIESFKAANLGEEWMLKIYGIKDDYNYLSKIERIIENDKNIKVFNPVFGDERQKIMASSWANILVSKSEVLSLSILEASHFGLPTITNENIELKEMDEFIIPTKTNSNDIREKIVEVSKWSDEFRDAKEERIKKVSEEKRANLNIKEQYINFYDKLISIKQDTFSKNTLFTKLFETLRKSENSKFLLISSAYTFNLMFSSLLVVLLVVFEKYTLAAETGLITSFWLTVTQIFSSNMRSIITSEGNLKLANETLFYRLIFSVMAIILFNYFALMNLDLINTELSLSISILILFQWFFEMNLLKYEIQNRLKIFAIFSSLNVLFIFLVVTFIIKDQFELIVNTIYVYVFLQLLFSATQFTNFFSNLKNLTSILKNNLNTIAFISSFSIISSSFIWRFMIYSILDKGITGVFYACFSIGSFPGTLFNSVIGPTFVKKNIVLNNYLKILIKVAFIVIFSVFVYSAFNIYVSDNFDFLSFDFIIFITSISLIGSFFMCNAMYSRHVLIQKTISERDNLFKTDIFYGVSITLFVPILYYFSGIVGTSFAFFLASVFAYLIYTRRVAKEN